MKPLAERVRELEGTGQYPWSVRVELSAIAAELERLAEELRDDGDPTCVNYVADQLAERKE